MGITVFMPDRAREFVKIVHEFDVHYSNIASTPWTSLKLPVYARAEPVRTPNVVRYHTTIKGVTCDTDRQHIMRFSSRKWKHIYIRDRNTSCAEKLLWQSHLPRIDYPLWFLGSTLLANPYVGENYRSRRERVGNAAQPNLRHPDQTFLAVVGRHDAIYDKTVN